MTIDIPQTESEELPLDPPEASRSAAPEPTDPSGAAASDGSLEAQPEPEDESDEEWMRRFIEENIHLASPPVVRPPASPPQPWDGPRSQWKVPDHLSMPHPKGGYMAMALMSRTMNDLDEVTGGKRAATYEEVDTYFGHALIAEGLVPFTYTADEAIHWWKAGGFRVLGSSTEEAANSPPAARMTNATFMANASAPDETSEAQGAAAVGSSIDMNANAMMIGEAPIGTTPKTATAPTTLTDVLEDVETWGQPKLAIPPNSGKSKTGPVAPSSNSAEARRGDIPVHNTAPSTPVPSSGVKFPRSWPVPIPATGVHFPRRGEKDVRGVAYSDGRYSPEGRYRKQRTGKPQRHLGDDVPGPLGTPVRAAADGVVVTASTQWAKVWARDPKTGKRLLKKDKNGKFVPYKVQGHGPEMAGWGNYITVAHPDGYITLYAHLQTVPRLASGTPVRLGQPIGVLGSTGNARGQGSHVHFEVHDRNRNTYNPVDWMEGRLPPRKR